MDEIESKKLMDGGEKVGVIKTLILEENEAVFSLMDMYANGIVNMHELARRLDLLATDRLEYFAERPKTAVQRKEEL